MSKRSKTSRTVILGVLIISCILLGLAVFSNYINQPPGKPSPMEFVRVAYEKAARAVVVELVIPNIDTVNKLARIELVITNTKSGSKFGMLINRSDRVDPIPPDAFGVINHPQSSDRSIKNISSAGHDGQWDQDSPNGTLLKQSASGVVGGNLGITVWVGPKGWSPDSYLIQTRTTQINQQPAPWQKLATFDYSERGVSQVKQSMGLVKPLFIDISYEKVAVLDYIQFVTLIRYDRKLQDKGVTMKRWAGDTSGQYKYVKIEETRLEISSLHNGVIPLEPGLYQFKHNSVTGRPPSGFYGESDFFEVDTEGGVDEIQVSLYRAI